MFGAETVWKGVVYSVLMMVGKLCTAVWLLPISAPRFGEKATQKSVKKEGVSAITSSSKGTNHDPPASTSALTKPHRRTSQAPKPATQISEHSPSNTAPPSPPRSLYPSAILSLAMASRGEVAFLIASVAESSGIFASTNLYLIVMWAAMINTIIGPLCVGLLVKRVKTLEKKRQQSGGNTNVLGSWGVGE